MTETWTAANEVEYNTLLAALAFAKSQYKSASDASRSSYDDHVISMLRREVDARQVDVDTLKARKNAMTPRKDDDEKEDGGKDYYAGSYKNPLYREIIRQHNAIRTTDGLERKLAEAVLQGMEKAYSIIGRPQTACSCTCKNCNAR